MYTLALGMPGGPELLVILFIVLLLFGAKKLPELSRSLGKSLGEFKKGKDDLEREIRGVEEDLHKAATEEIKEEPVPAPDKPDEEKPAADA
ncbi:twin-arginine translocase TatA/TatE family subunit [Pontiellaceae bacterium B12227]|nr:twin-arginine translocase TatA/TatE family subunit [Pontiellaceae bacterium B12227]